MKFDIAIGNPPYLSRLYYEFLKMGHYVSDYTCMITPDSWTDNLPELEECLSNIVVYKNVDDVFKNKKLKIRMGVSYGLINKTQQNKQSMRVIFNNNDSGYINYNKDHVSEIEYNILNKLNKIEYDDHFSKKNIMFQDNYTVCFQSALGANNFNNIAYAAKVYKFGYDKDMRYTFDNLFAIGCDSLEEVYNVLSYVFNPLMEFFLLRKHKSTYLNFRLYFDKTIKYTFDYLCDLYNITQSEKEYLKNNYGIHTNDLKLTFYK